MIYATSTSNQNVHALLEPLGTLSVEFDVTVLQEFTDWGTASNVLRIGDSDDDWTPSFWINTEFASLKVTMGDFVYESGLSSIDSRKRYHLKMQVQDGAVSFYLNSELMKQGKTGHTTHRKHVSVWVSDPWNDAVDAKVSNLKIDGGTGN